jgi:hypothetical protein
MRRLYGLLPLAILLAIVITGVRMVSAQDVTFTARYNDSTKARIVKVDIASPWTDTGMDVSAGEHYNINVEGIASTDGATVPQDAYWYDAAGGRVPADNTYPLPGAPIQSIIGRVGATGTPFYVGTLFTFNANKSGRLFLGFNDTFFGDNAGYYVAFINGDPITHVSTSPLGPPQSFTLEQNYPNPFNPSTTITFELPKPSHVSLSVFDLLGREVSVLVNERRNAGAHEVKFDASGFSSGVYFYRLQAGDFVRTRKFVLLR